MPEAVRGWLKAVGLDEEELIELIFTENEVLLRRPTSPQLRAWAKGVSDKYDQTFRELIGI